MVTDNKRGFSMAEACRYIGGVSRGQMYRLMGDEEIQSYLIGSRRYFLREDLDRFLDRSVGREGGIV